MVEQAEPENFKENLVIFRECYCDIIIFNFFISNVKWFKIFVIFYFIYLKVFFYFCNLLYFIFTNVAISKLSLFLFKNPNQNPKKDFLFLLIYPKSLLSFELFELFELINDFDFYLKTIINFLTFFVKSLRREGYFPIMLFILKLLKKFSQVVRAFCLAVMQ